MTTMTLQIDNPSIFEHLKTVLGLMKGVTIVGVTDNWMSIYQMRQRSQL